MPKDLISVEKSVTICPDEHQKLLRWYPNLARRDYFVQGRKKHKVYPDVISATISAHDPNDYDSTYVAETKGLHLKGSEDTTYNTNVFDFCNTLGKQKDWHEPNLEFKDKRIAFHVIYEDEWRNRINQILG